MKKVITDKAKYFLIMREGFRQNRKTFHNFNEALVNFEGNFQCIYIF